jgi:hypothetical protein
MIKSFKVGILFKGQLFEEYSKAILNILNQNNFSAKFISEKDFDCDSIIIINPLNFLKLKFKKKIKYYGIQTEQLYLPNEYSIDTGFSNLVLLKMIINKYTAIFDWSYEAVKYIESIYPGKYFYLNHGFLTNFNESENSFDPKKEIYDICFLGWETGVDNRRQIILDNLKKKYTFFPKNKGVWGEEKRLAILQSKIILNIHFDHSLAFENPRFFEAFSLEKFLLSEDVFQSYPFEVGKHFDVFNEYNIYEKIDFYLNNSELRYKIAKNAKEKVKTLSLKNEFNKVINRMLLDKKTDTFKRKLKVFLLKFNFLNPLLFLYFRFRKAIRNFFKKKKVNG